MAGFVAPFLLYAAMLLLHVLLPSRQVQGYVLDLETGRPLNYRLNGLLTFFVVLALWLVADLLGWLKWDWLYLHRWSALAGACTLGLGFTLICYRHPQPASLYSQICFWVALKTLST